MKRVIALILCGVVLLTTLLSSVSCADGGNEGTNETKSQTAPAQEIETADPNYADELPEMSFGGETVHALVAGQNGASDELYAEKLNQELINDAVYERNRTVESRLDILLEIDRADSGGSLHQVAKKIHDLVMTGTDDYQFCSGPSFITVKNIVNGDYLNLPDFVWLNLDKYYWSQGYNDMATWGDGYQYTASGSIALSLFRYMYVTLYNKDIMVNYQLDDPYETVAAGMWTIEYQTQLTSGMYRDLNGDGLSGKEDAFGFVSGNHISSDPYWISSQATVLDKDENGYYVYNADTARIYDAVDAVLALYYRPDAFIFLEENDQTSSESIITAFSENRAFMVTVMINKLETSLRDFKGEYAILPIPKLDVVQDRYHTCVQDQVTGFSVPACCPDSKQDMVGAVLECLASESYKTVVDAYYNTALSYRYLNNPESKVILDLIYENVSFEIAQVYTGTIGNFLVDMRSIIKSKQNTTTSTFKKMKKTMEKAVKDVNAAYERIVSR